MFGWVPKRKRVQLKLFRRSEVGEKKKATNFLSDWFGLTEREEKASRARPFTHIDLRRSLRYYKPNADFPSFFLLCSGHWPMVVFLFTNGCCPDISGYSFQLEIKMIELHEICYSKNGEMAIDLFVVPFLLLTLYVTTNTFFFWQSLISVSCFLLSCSCWRSVVWKNLPSSLFWLARFQFHFAVVTYSFSSLFGCVVAAI